MLKTQQKLGASLNLLYPGKACSGFPAVQTLHQCPASDHPVVQPLQGTEGAV